MPRRTVRVRLTTREEGGYRLHIQGPDVDGVDSRALDVELPANAPERTVEFVSRRKLNAAIDEAVEEYEARILPMLALRQAIRQAGGLDQYVGSGAKQEASNTR